MSFLFSDIYFLISILSLGERRFYFHAQQLHAPQSGS